MNSVIDSAARSAHFTALVEYLREHLLATERFTLWYSGECSDFIRFNQGLVRQAGQVEQASVTLKLIDADRHADAHLSLCGELETDRQQLGISLQQLRDTLPALSADPYLLLDDTAWQSDNAQVAELPDSAKVVEAICTAAEGLDLVGFYASGPIYRGFASSWGALGWHAATSFNLDWSLFHGNGQAVKSNCAGQTWNDAAFDSAFNAAKAQLELLGLPMRSLKPGAYRAYLAPAALEEIIDMLRWSGFSARDLATHQSSLQRLQSGAAQLSPLLSLRESASDGLAPAFTADGSLRSDVQLLDAGHLSGQLVSSRSAKEYGLPSNGATAYEAPQSVEVAAGHLAQQDILQTLGTGLYIGNLWYLNFSDQPAARMTGMTRFATFWVENGVIQGPVKSMRFDDSIFDFLGQHLLDLTRKRTLSLSAGTYGERQTSSTLLPGALTARLLLTL